MSLTPDDQKVVADHDAVEDAKRWQFLVKFDLDLISCDCEVEPYRMWAVTNRNNPREGSMWHSHQNIAIDEARRAMGDLV